MTLIICPNCDAQYDLPANAIGAAGRKVKCASCAKDWHAMPVEQEEIAQPQVAAAGAGGGGNVASNSPAEEPARPTISGVMKDVEAHLGGLQANAGSADDEPEADALFDENDERALDAAFEAEAQLADQEAADSSASGGAETSAGGADLVSFEDHQKSEEPLDEEELARRRDALRRRHRLLEKDLPRFKIRRWSRLALGVFLLTTTISGILFRDFYVERVPELAWIYGLFGQEINVVGLEIGETQTMRTLLDGAETLVISAEIKNLRNDQRAIPPVHVVLQNDEGVVLYEWNARPREHVLQAREILNFETQLVSPPLGATQISLSFSDSNG